MRRLYALALVGMLLVLPGLVLPGAPATAEVTAERGETVVSLTFDDGFKGQEAAARALAEQDIAGTFYINSGYLGYPAYLTVAEVKAIARMGHEIGGHSLSHDHLTKMSPARAKNEICNDRATLDRLGFQVTSLPTPTVRTAVT